MGVNRPTPAMNSPSPAGSGGRPTKRPEMAAENGREGALTLGMRNGERSELSGSLFSGEALICPLYYVHTTSMAN